MEAGVTELIVREVNSEDVESCRRIFYDALVGSAGAFIGFGIRVPTRNDEPLRCSLGHTLGIVQQSTPMTIDLYNDPTGAYLPSILY